MRVKKYHLNSELYLSIHVTLDGSNFDLENFSISRHIIESHL